MYVPSLRRFTSFSQFYGFIKNAAGRRVFSASFVRVSNQLVLAKRNVPVIEP